MNHRLAHVVQRERASELLAPGAAVVGGILVLLIMAWLIWAALAEAAAAGIINSNGSMS
jgi:hypothetical protein